MTTTIPYPNRFAEERARLGLDAATLAARCGIAPDWYAHIEAGEVLPTLEEFDRLRAVLGDLPREQLYDYQTARVIGGTHSAATGLSRATHTPTAKPDYATFWGDLEGTEHLLVSRDEANWLERNTQPDRDVDVFLNLSCGPQRSPNINLDTVNVLRALGVNFAAGAGRLFCCGHYYRGHSETEAARKMNDASVGRAVAWGAKTMAHWCGNCVNMYGDLERRERLLGHERPTNLPMYVFLESVLNGIVDIPWKREVPAKVLVLRVDSTAGHTEATDACMRILAKIPGVEVVGTVDEEIQRAADLRNADGGLTGGTNSLVGADKAPVKLEEMTREQIHARRARLADLFAARGADTMSAAHHSPHISWARLASERLAVRHPVSLLAAALDCASPDRYQAAFRVGDPDAVVEQTRPIWTSWKMKEERARELAHAIFKPQFGAENPACTCGSGDGCGERLIEVDVLGGVR